jgi:hypothetical protein
MSFRSDATSQRHLRPRIVAGVLVALFVLTVLALMPGAWALPEQSPDFQTVPTLTPTPTRPGTGPTATPAPTDTPGGQPTDTPAPPGATATNTPTSPPGATATPTPTSTRTTVSTPTRSAPVAPVQPGVASCWTVPTPGFSPQSALAVEWRIESDQFLVTPGQTITQRLWVRNVGSTDLPDVLICNPLNPALVPGQPAATQGQARIEQQGLVVELGDLATGQTAQVDLDLAIPADFPLGGVIESQALLFSDGRQASTDLLTWALPPAYLPPTGR